MPRDVIDRHLRDAPLFPFGDRFGTIAEVIPLARFHLDEHGVAALARDDVDFTEACAIAPLDDVVSASAQLAARKIFPEDSQRVPALCHGPTAIA